MRYLLISFFALALFACDKEQQLTLAEANDNFISGSFAGESFHFASTDDGYHVQNYYAPSHQPEMLPLGYQPGRYEVGLNIGRTDPAKTQEIRLRLKDNLLHTREFPYRFSADGTAIISRADYAFQAEARCPGYDPGPSANITVTADLISWDNDVLHGTFRSADGATTGTFKLKAARPKI